MRLVTYSRDGTRRLGAWIAEGIVDLPDAVGHPAFPTTLEALLHRNGGTVLEAVYEALEKPDTLDYLVPRAKLLVPLLPSSLRDFLAFEDHVKAGAKRRKSSVPGVWYEMPIYYKGNHRSVMRSAAFRRRATRSFHGRVDHASKAAFAAAMASLASSREAWAKVPITMSWSIGERSSNQLSLSRASPFT